MPIRLRTASRYLTCGRCGTAFTCGSDGACWCAAEPFRLALPAAAAEDCLCPACLRAAALENVSIPKGPVLL